MKQQTLGGFQKFGKTRRRAKFLGEVVRIMPWKELAAAVGERPTVDSLSMRITVLKPRGIYRPPPTPS